MLFDSPRISIAKSETPHPVHVSVAIVGSLHFAPLQQAALQGRLHQVLSFSVRAPEKNRATYEPGPARSHVLTEVVIAFHASPVPLHGAH
jgi:hypothetical protein